MERYLILREKYDFRAPLVTVEKDFVLLDYLKKCSSKSMSTQTICMVTSVCDVLYGIEEKTCSLDFVASEIDKKKSNVRHHLIQLEKQGLVTALSITTDPVRRRPGVLYTLTNNIRFTESIPNDKAVPIEVVAAAEVQDNVALSNTDELIIEVLVIRFLAKAMRTNRKDNRNSISVNVLMGKGASVPITCFTEFGKIMHVPDLSYYVSTMSWLFSHIQGLQEKGVEPPETYNIPLESILELSQRAFGEDLTSGGYVNNAINAFKRISNTTFNLNLLPDDIKSKLNIKSFDVFYKLFRLEGIVNYESRAGGVKKALRLQFPRTAILNIMGSISKKLVYADLMQIDEGILRSRNEVEILLSLWARDSVVSNKLLGRTYTWNELRETVAPNTTMSEFKRKFSAVMIANQDRSYTAKVTKNDTDKTYKMVGTCYVSEDSKKVITVEYCRSIFQGLIINVGHTDNDAYSVIYVRKDVSALALRTKISTSRGGEQLVFWHDE